MRKISVVDLKKNKELLEKMYSLVLDDYYETEKNKYPIENYIANISSNNNQKVIYYIDNNDEVICYLELEKLNLNEYYISTLTTSKEYRGKGYAKLLLNELMTELTHSIQEFKIKIFVNSEKGWLINYYESLGFDRIDPDDKQRTVSMEYDSRVNSNEKFYR